MDGGNHSSGTASAGFLEGVDLIESDVASLDHKTEFLSDGSQAHVGDRGQDGAGIRGHILAVLDTEEVGGTGLVDEGFRLGIGENGSAEAFLMSAFASTKGSGVVATDLHVTGAQRSCTVIILGNLHVSGFETFLEVRSDRHHEDDEEVFVSRFHTDGGTSTDKQRTDIEGTLGAVRRNVFCVGLDHHFQGIKEQLLRNLG